MFIDSYLPGSLVDAGDVDGGHELNSRRVVRIVWPTVNVHTVYPVLMDALYPESVSQARTIGVGWADIREEGPKLFHSSCSSSCPLHRQDRKNRLL